MRHAALILALLTAACASGDAAPAPPAAACALPNAATNTAHGKCAITACVGDFADCERMAKRALDEFVTRKAQEKMVAYRCLAFLH